MNYLNWILFTVSLILFSCKKDHVCVCGEKVSGVSFTIHDTQSKAKKSCDLYEEDYKQPCVLE